MILREPPDLPPRPLTPTNAEFRARFYARWGKENTVVTGRSRYAEYAPLKQALSIKTVRGGTETYTVEKRHYLIKQRLAAASRLVNRSDLDLSEIAPLAGFGTRWSLFRHLRKKTGEGGGDLRKATSTMS